MTDTKPFDLMRFVELCTTAEVAPGSAVKVESGERTLAVFNIDDQFYVTDDLCTHGPGSLSEGYIDGDVVECDFHNGAFNIRTGEVVAPPCMVPLKTYLVYTADGKVYIDPNQPACPSAFTCPKAVANG
ncbi:non-heme iron oxygenase ferredoxin subunit [Massilia niastensis]|uniref:non-heme iron oxygenase ferredoxin subunit n=1 Tax=Massilia niastensis TaxID=544911 RepID=UPI001E6381CE|nr:non-heme iron oxygenase ferredoxin subunit [Massilia niastensis]